MSVLAELSDTGFRHFSVRADFQIVFSCKDSLVFSGSVSPVVRVESHFADDLSAQFLLATITSKVISKPFYIC